MEYYAPRCANLPTDTTVAPDSVARPTTPVPTSTPTPAPAPARRVPSTATRPATSSDSVTVYSIQVAAYETRAAAERTAKSLVSRGIDARVDGLERPFRVRIGRYSTHAAAMAAAASLKTKGITGFLTTARMARR